MKHIVDAHPLIWFLQQDKRLGASAHKVLTDPDSALIIPATAYGEVCWIIEHGRTNIPSVAVLQTVLSADPRLTIYPLDRTVIDCSQELTLIGEKHDRQIVATALILAEQGQQIALLTRDANIMASGLVPVLW